MPSEDPQRPKAGGRDLGPTGVVVKVSARFRVNGPGAEIDDTGAPGERLWAPEVDANEVLLMAAASRKSMLPRSEPDEDEARLNVYALLAVGGR